MRLWVVREVRLGEQQYRVLVLALPAALDKGGEIEAEGPLETDAAALEFDLV
ncbi:MULTISPECIES: hypothetical protein [Asaia]|uniref:Uncharacterized protein n=1 Tax=Asaia bogorensis TaxID=91915 RepID=A0A060QJY7_9PROT|nr:MULTISPECIES: hypothetical protein [Asaia]ETC97759.1 hypothetical protein P792_14245 [Asaia sp. SF2.1]CDG41295.1 hypothetical protein ASAP_3250 [Asaia bogorensis]